MASTGDIRDIMDLGHDGPRQPALKKKKKNVEPQPRLSGMSREVQALMGDSVPPVAIVETPKYKQKPSIAMKMFKPRHWEDRSFVHGARKDGLQLHHWKRSIPGSNIRTPVPPNTESMDVDDGAETSGTPLTAELLYEAEFPSEKWNVQPPIASYNDEQYEKYFTSEEWTKEETDRLIELCHDYSVRWTLVADRYDPADITPKTSDAADGAVKPAYPARRMEELKQRYYTIAAKMLEIGTPASNMTQSEFQLWEKMRNFDARSEIQRKSMAEKLFERTKEEAEEEKVLLEELYRISKNEEDFIKIRKELYSRLETAPSLRRNERGEEPSTAIYQTSQGLSMLLSSLLAKEKRLKTRIAPNGQEVPTAQTPVDNQRSRQGNQHSRRETMDSNAGDDHVVPSKKGSVAQTPVVRTLTPAEEVKFGVSHPQERITSGVMFRHEKINRLTMAKSQVQTQKIGAALTELGIPPRLLMPTERVCREFERLVSEVQILLDTRRVLEKVSSEVKVLEEHKKLRLGDDQADSTNVDSMQVDGAVDAGNGTTGADAKAGDQPSSSTANGTQSQSDKQATAQPTATNGIKQSTSQDDENAGEDETPVRDDEEDDNEADQSMVAADDDDEEDEGGDGANQSFARQDEEGVDEEEVEEEEDDENEVTLGQDEDEDEGEDEDDDDAPGLDDLERANQVTDDEDEDNEEEDSGNQVRLVDDDDEDDDEDGGQEDEDEDEAEVDESMVNGAEEEEEEDDDDEGEDEDEDEEPARPTSSHSNLRAHKRSASVLSEASRAGSNRSGAGRKKRK